MLHPDTILAAIALRGTSTLPDIQMGLEGQRLPVTGGLQEGRCWCALPAEDLGAILGALRAGKARARGPYALRRERVEGELVLWEWALELEPGWREVRPVRRRLGVAVAKLLPR